MTHITVYQSSGKIIGFKSEGHSGYAEQGSDIICSAVSVLTLNTINSIEQFTDDDFEGAANEQKAFVEIKVVSSPVSEKTQVLLDACVLGLQSIADNNPKYVSIDFKEV
ncbi:MAG: ribosomal-processing cysteine protease Prp [Lachnospira sp.]